MAGLSLMAREIDAGSHEARATPASGTAMTGGRMGGTTGPVPVSRLPKTPVQSVTQMIGLVMPAGMIVTRDASAGMAAVPPSQATNNDTETQGGGGLTVPIKVG